MSDIIKKLYHKGLRFDCLFDASFGEGITPNSREAPAFDDFDILQGYAGGISPSNVKDLLKKLQKLYLQKESFSLMLKEN